MLLLLFSVSIKSNETATTTISVESDKPQSQDSNGNPDGKLIFTYVKDTVIDNRLNQQQYILIPGIRARAKDLSEIASTGSTYRTKGLFVFESPKPQKVGENKTTNSDIYRVIWRISNSQNEVTEAEVRAVLPVVGAWNNSTVRPSSAKSSISHNEATGEIVWRIGRVESYTGMVRTPIEISFDLEIPRGEKELLRNLKGSGIDVFTGERFEENRGNISP